VAHICALFTGDLFHLTRQAESYVRKDLFLPKRSIPLLVLPYRGFSSVAGRGNLTKEAPAKVTTRALNNEAQNLLRNFATVHLFFDHINAHSFGARVGVALTGWAVYQGIDKNTGSNSLTERGLKPARQKILGSRTHCKGYTY